MGVCQEPPCLVTEYCQRGSLTDVLSEGQSDPAAAAQLTWHRRLRMVRLLLPLLPLLLVAAVPVARGALLASSSDPRCLV